MPSNDNGTPQNWSGLTEGQHVSVREPGRGHYSARIEAMHEAKVVWVISDHGGFRRAFDYREGVVISSV